MDEPLVVVPSGKIASDGYYPSVSINLYLSVI